MDFNIKSFLEKYKTFTPPHDFIKKAFISAVLEETGIAIESKDIRIVRNTIYLTASPAVKSELYIKKPLLLERVRSKLEKGNISDIR